MPSTHAVSRESFPVSVKAPEGQDDRTNKNPIQSEYFRQAHTLQDVILHVK